MHDWTLEALFVIWSTGNVEINCKNDRSESVQIVAAGLVDIRIPKREEWGASVSINEVSVPVLLENGNVYLSLEIQSGDKIELEAKSISMPNF